MSKNRTIPFGYMMKNGEIQPESTECQAVRKIFKMYLNSSSLTEIANHMSSSGIPYNEVTSLWNKNMVKRILENEKYLGKGSYPALIDEDIFRKVNIQKQQKSTQNNEISEELKVIREITFCAECGHKLSRIGGNSRSEKWDCRNPECERLGYRVTDNMLIGTIINTLNTAIANPNLLDTNAEISTYTPSIEVTRQQNEINRYIDSSDVDFDKAKEEIFKLAKLKYDCCTYDDIPQKTVQLKVLLSSCEQQNTLDIGLLESCISRISVSHFYTIEVEFINGVTIKNITERNEKNDHSSKCQSDSCNSTNSGKP